MEVYNRKTWSLISTEDYDRAIDTPEFVMPKQLEDFVIVLNEKGKKAAAYEYDKIRDELKESEGFIDDIDMRTEENDKKIADAISDDEDMKELIADVEKLKDRFHERSRTRHKL